MLTRTRSVVWNAFLVSALAISSCAQQVYTTKDLSPLPCEPASFYFLPAEFGTDGTPSYPDQLETIQHKLEVLEVEDVFIFVHGWDKPSIVAEQEYQNFICRLYGKGWPETKLPKPSSYLPHFRNSAIIGLFWPSSVFPNFSDPDILKLATYYAIRDRADSLAYVGMQQFLRAVIKAMEKRGPSSKLNLHFIGHSFGSRVIVKGLYTHFEYYPMEGKKFIAGLNQINLVLLLSALPRSYLTRPDVYVKQTQEGRRKHALERHEHFKEALASRDVEEVSIIFHQIVSLVAERTFLPQLEREIKRIRIFNIFSQNDYASRFLFPIASMFTPDDSVDCALGGCRALDYPTIEIGAAGHVIFPTIENKDNIWNVDASPIIFSHADIYKGRVAGLIWELLTWQE